MKTRLLLAAACAAIVAACANTPASTAPTMAVPQLDPAKVTAVIADADAALTIANELAAAKHGGQVDPVEVVRNGIVLATAAVDQLVAAGKLPPDSVAKLQALKQDANTAMLLLPAVGAVASLADPKLAPAFGALQALQSGLKAVGAPAATS